MRTASGLLSKLGIENCTVKHLNIINIFLNSGSRDARMLLDQLGDWDDKDLKIAEEYLNE